MSSLVSPLYGADDLYIRSLGDEGSRICGHKPMGFPNDLPDTFESQVKKERVKNLAKKGLTLSAIALGLWSAVKFAPKLLAKLK